MKRTILLIGTFLLISAMVVFGGGAKEKPGAAEEENVIKIGAIISHTGDEAEQSIEFKRANDLLLAQLNAKGGIHGYPISLISVDGQSKPDVHAAKAHRLLETENVIAGYGGADISTATAAGKIFQDAETVFIDILGFLNPDIMVYYDMFVSVYCSSNRSRYMRIIQSVRRGRKVQHRHVLSLGPYDERNLHRYRAIVAAWKPLECSAAVLEELANESGHLQGRGFFRSFRRW